MSSPFAERDALSTSPTEAHNLRRYGFVGIIVTDRERLGARLNQVLSSYSDCIIGRLGLPNLEGGTLAIITLIVHATTDRLSALTGKLGALPGISVKSALHRVPEWRRG